MTETQQRFLRAIAERLGERQPIEVRLFPSIRPGHYESGVAVVAIEGGLAADDVIPTGTLVTEGSHPAPSDVPEHDAAAAEAGVPVDPMTAADESAAGPEASAADDTARDPARRFSILTARYRLTLKGPDRGKWEFSLVHDADAPLHTVEPVVRGVARRVGDADEPQLLDTEAFARAIAEPWWTTTA